MLGIPTRHIHSHVGILSLDDVKHCIQLVVELIKVMDVNTVDKNNPIVLKVKEWVDAEYENGRVTVITDEELIDIINEVQEELGVDLKAENSKLTMG